MRNKDSVYAEFKKNVVGKNAKASVAMRATASPQPSSAMR